MKKATKAEKLLYQAIFQASCCLVLGNFKACAQLLSDAMREINKDYTYIAQAVFGIVNEEKK